MRIFCVAFCVTVWSVLSAFAVEIEGSAGLSTGDSPVGIRVTFTAASPSAVSDTIYLDGTGRFDIYLEPGWYHVNYWRMGYANYYLGHLNIRFNGVFPHVTLMPPLSGQLVGTIGPGDYQVRDSLYVPNGLTATILPGTRLFFERVIPFRVEGRLIAIGTEQDSIIFTRRYTTGYQATWRGMTFIASDPGTELRFVVVEHAIKAAYVSGGGLHCRDSHIRVSRSTFRYNHGDYGGGMFIRQSAAEIDSCTFFQNIANSGAGIALNDANALISNTLFAGNDAEFSGGGLYSENYDSSVVYRCLFHGNEAFDGAGMAVVAVPLVVTGCVFTYNRSPRTAALLCNNATGARITRCTMVRNGTTQQAPISSLAFFGGAPTVSTIIVAEYFTRFGVMFSVAQNAVFRYSDIYVPGGDPIGFSGSDSAHGPAGIGVLNSYNIRGDVCDSYQNIYFDPEFTALPDGDFSLADISPCIDTGDPSLPFDPDGTIPDMGAFYFPQPVTAAEPASPAPASFTLSSYPNPFNGITRVRFDLPFAGPVELAVFDIAGRRVATLVAGTLDAGTYERSVDLLGQPSGVYLCRLKHAGYTQTQKLVLMK